MTDSKKFLVVGIGASAGGIPAMEGFFRGVPDDCGMAFVVVTHLSPDRESLLHEVIARYTEMPVQVDRARRASARARLRLRHAAQRAS